MYSMIKVISLTCLYWNICMLQRRRSEATVLQITCECPYASSNANDDCDTMKVLLNWLACHEQFDWPKKIIIVFMILCKAV